MLFDSSFLQSIKIRIIGTIDLAKTDTKTNNSGKCWSHEIGVQSLSRRYTVPFPLAMQPSESV